MLKAVGKKKHQSSGESMGNRWVLGNLLVFFFSLENSLKGRICFSPNIQAWFQASREEMQY